MCVHVCVCVCEKERKTITYKLIGITDYLFQVMRFNFIFFQVTICTLKPVLPRRLVIGLG